MIQGCSFDPLGRVYVPAQVEIYGTMSSSPISFLVDTGATDIVMSFDDGKKLQIDYPGLGAAQPLSTLGGAMKAYRLSGLITFLHNGLGCVYQKDIYVAEPSSANMGQPSLLGQVILRHWSISVCYRASRIELEPLGWDYTV